MDSRTAGTLLIVAGLVLVVAGCLWRAGLLSFLGRLPGDFRFEGEHTRVYFPFVTMLLVSVVLSVIVAVLRRWF